MPDSGHEYLSVLMAPTAARHAVALARPEDKSANTIVLGGAVVVIPLEIDPDHDPLHDDEVRLWSQHGGYDRTILASDPQAEADLDARLMHYRFEDVPRGVYRVAVCTAGQWHDLMYGLVVAQDGVFLGGKKLESEKPPHQAAPPPDTHELTDIPDDSDGLEAPEPRQASFAQTIWKDIDG